MFKKSERELLIDALLVNNRVLEKEIESNPIDLESKKQLLDEFLTVLLKVINLSNLAE